MGDDLFMSNMEIALVVLLSGLVIVFAVLFLLIGIVKGYGMIVLTVTGKREAKRKEKAERAKAAAKAAQKEPASKPEAPAAVPTPAAAPAPAAEAVQDGIPGDVIAAIAAAVDFMYGTGTHVVAGVKRISPNRSAWASAGMIESTRPF